jgi:hypothetical protein
VGDPDPSLAIVGPRRFVGGGRQGGGHALQHLEIHRQPGRGHVTQSHKWVCKVRHLTMGSRGPLWDFFLSHVSLGVDLARNSPSH